MCIWYRVQYGTNSEMEKRRVQIQYLYDDYGFTIFFVLLDNCGFFLVFLGKMEGGVRCESSVRKFMDFILGAKLGVIVFTHGILGSGFV